MSTTIMPVPIQTPMVDDRGLVTTHWAAFFEKLRIIQAAAGGGGGDTDVSVDGTLLTGASQGTADFKGNHVSVMMFGAARDGVTDDTVAFQDALDEAGSFGVERVYAPSGNYSVGRLDIPAGITLFGDGERTKLIRAGAITSGFGWIDMTAAGSGIESLQLEGGVTSPTGLLYGAGTSSTLFNNDPMDSKLTDNSTIWVHDGAHDFKVRRVIIRHTGGYAVLVDARDGDIRGGLIEGCLLENNRPHTFGTDVGDMNYGSWTGGIHWQSDGRSSASKLFGVKGLKISGNVVRRSTGAGMWGHLYGFDELHQNVRLENNFCQDVAYHNFQLGGQRGGSIKGNVSHRAGFVTLTDGDTPVPMYLAGAYCSGIDIAGLCIGAVIAENVILSPNGDGMDLDGLAHSSVTGNSVVIPASGEYGYTQDDIASIGPGGAGDNWTYGLQTGNTNALQGGEGLTITGNTFRNMGGGALRLYAARKCLVTGNNVYHPATYNVRPITLGNTGTASGARAQDNVVSGNVIHWSPATAAAAVWEDNTLGAFDPADRNYVTGNRLIGNCFEFLRDSVTISDTGVAFSTNASGITAASEFILRREGTGISAAVKGYTRNGTATKQRLQVADFRDGSNEDSVLNVSLDGAAGTGVICTANRSTFGFGDLVASGYVLGYGFMAILGKTATGNVYDDTRADLLTDDWALLRFDEATNTIQQSVSTSAGARVWTSLGGGLSIGGSDTQVQFNDGGVLAGDSGLVWDKTNNVLTVTGVVSTAAIYVGTGYVYSAGGFNVPVANTATDAIQATGGGVTAKWLITTESIFGIAVATPAVSASSQGKLHFNSTSNKWEYSENGSSWANCFGTGSVAGANTEVQFNNSGAFGASSSFTWTNGSKLFTVTGNTGTAGITTVTCYIQSAEGFLTNDASSDAVNVPNGGVTALSLISIRNDGASGVYITRSSATARSYGFGVNSSGSLVLRDETGAANRLTMDTSGLITIGTTVAINQSGAVTISGVLNCNGASGGVNVSSNSAYNCIQASASGGMAARSFTASAYIQMGQNAGAPTATTSDTLNNGALYYDTSTNRARVRISGSFVDIATGSATVAGADTQVQFNDGGAFGAESAFTWNKTTNVLTITGSTGTAGIVAATCYIQSAEGFYTTSASYQCVQAPSGGVYGSSVQAINYTQPGRRASDPTATSGDTIADGCLYYNTSTAKLKVRISSSFVDVVTGSSGVTSLNSLTGALSIGAGTAISVSPSGSTVTITNTGLTFLSSGTGISVSANTGSVTVTNTGVTFLSAGTGVSVTANTGSITISIGQAVATSSNVTFASVTTGSGGVVQSGATGTSISFQNTNFNFQVNGNGVVSCTTVNVSGSTAINSSRQFVGAGVDVGSNGISCGNYNLNGGFVGRTVTTTDGGGNTLIFRGGILTIS